MDVFTQVMTVLSMLFSIFFLVAGWTKMSPNVQFLDGGLIIAVAAALLRVCGVI